MGSPEWPPEDDDWRAYAFCTACGRWRRSPRTKEEFLQDFPHAPDCRIRAMVLKAQAKVRVFLERKRQTK